MSKKVHWMAFCMLGAVCGAAIWLASPSFTGRAEPWDALVPYYPVALASAGLLLGLLSGAFSTIPYSLSGIFLGQVAVLVARGAGMLVIFSALFLALYLLPATLGVLLGTCARKLANRYLLARPGA
jgi:hypothetical protein